METLELYRGKPLLRYLIGAGVISLALSGCTTNRYVSRPCLSAEQLEEQRKAEPEKVGPKLTGKADEDSKILAGSAIRLRGWGQGMLGILEGCAQ